MNSLSQEANWHLQILSQASITLPWSCLWGDSWDTAAELERSQVLIHSEHQNNSSSWLYLDRGGIWEAEQDRPSAFPLESLTATGMKEGGDVASLIIFCFYWSM